MKTVEAFGMQLPVIAELSDGYILVAHPNGPALLSGDTLATLDFAVREKLRIASEAVEKYREWSWPVVRHLAYPEVTE